jgi:hypothetical protein
LFDLKKKFSRQNHTSRWIASSYLIQNVFHRTMTLLKKQQQQQQQRIIVPGELFSAEASA